MGRLTIKKVIYQGDNYYYESPDFNDGLNIIVGYNGNGVTGKCFWRIFGK